MLAKQTFAPAFTGGQALLSISIKDSHLILIPYKGDTLVSPFYRITN